MYIIYILPTENLCWNDQCHCFVLSLFFSPSNLVISPRINPNYINVKLCRLSLGHACCLGVNFFPSLSFTFYSPFVFNSNFVFPKCKGMRTRTSLFSVLNGTRSVISYGHYLQLTIIPYPMYSGIGNLLFLFQLLSFFPSLFAHPFLSILSFSFSSQLVDKSLSCTRIYLNNTSV